MTHLTLEQLLELREPGQEPGVPGARQHLETCQECQREADRLAQRIARLRALPQPRPARDHFAVVRARYLAERRRRRLRVVGLGALALAATVVLAVAPRAPSNSDAAVPPADPVLAELIARSQMLEITLQEWDPDSRVLDGRTAAIAARLEDQLSQVDRQIEFVTLLQRRSAAARAEQLRLWRERVGLLDALVDVHVTRARFAGM
jgi:hypothetical protein